MNDQRRHDVVIGTGPVGTAVARVLAARGRAVRAVNRSGRSTLPPTVPVTAGDVSDPAFVRRACMGAHVVYYCASPPYAEWPRRFPGMMEALVKGVAGTGARVVFADNLYAYGRVSGPIREDLPYRATGPKGRARAGAARRLLEEHARGNLWAAIGRASNFYGPGVADSVVGRRVFEAAASGKPVELLGDIDLPHSFTYVDDFARGLVTLGERDEALGQAWHVANAEAPTTRQFVEEICRQAGTEPRFRVAPRLVVSLMSLVNRQMRELKEVLYEFEEPYVVDHSRFQRAFGGEPTPLREGIRATLQAEGVQTAPAAAVAA
ncbi:MAG TPA: NAD-dependent epimerase/dehydratase family protein [Longimicrobium sp.]